jgi:A/G-specific adenine glycosylase
MPWRATKGNPANPYHVVVSEFMLQQTQVATVIPYFNRFITRWPTLKALAKAKLDDVRAAWAGLGYYRRANFLHRLAVAVTENHGGVLPQEERELLALPGLGPYAAAAIAAIAFGKQATVVDGNVERVMARIFMLEETGVKLRSKVYDALMPVVPAKRAGDFAQAVMELGALVCTPRSPDCPHCPWQKNCMAFASGTQEDFPRKLVKKTVPEKHAAIFVLTDSKGRVLMRRRPESGLLAGLWEFPSTPWETARPDAKVTARHAPAKTAWRRKGHVTHVFSHFKLHLTLQLGHSRTTFSLQDGSYRWMKREELSTIALPTVMRKVADAAFDTDA